MRLVGGQPREIAPVNARVRVGIGEFQAVTLRDLPNHIVVVFENQPLRVGCLGIGPVG